MSSNLSWEPKCERGTFLCYELKVIFRNRFGDPVSRELDEQDIPYLEGIIDGSENEKVVEQTEALIEAIKTFQIIVLDEH